MEDIDTRLRESTDACIKSFENWIKQNKDLESRETLMEAMHDVRKVLSRVEIEIAISERDRLGSRPLPIPPHRSSRKGPGEESDSDDGDSAPPQQQRQGGRNNRQRRPMQNRGGGNDANGNSNSDQA